jgi:polyphosphate kinase
LTFADLSPRHSVNKPEPAAELTRERFLNRELGILAFQRRVLAQAEDPSAPLLERLRFLCIVSSNLDEFFEIRVAGLKEQINVNPDLAARDGLSAREVYRRVSAVARELVARQYQLLNQEVFPALAE